MTFPENVTHEVRPQRGNTRMCCDLLNRAPQQDCHVAVAPRNDADPIVLCSSKGHSCQNTIGSLATLPVIRWLRQPPESR